MSITMEQPYKNFVNAPQYLNDYFLNFLGTKVECVGRNTKTKHGRVQEYFLCLTRFDTRATSH